MDNKDLKNFGEAIVITLEPGDTDKNGNKYADHDAYEVAMDEASERAQAELKNFDPAKQF